MRVVLVSTYTHPVALGLRYVSAFIKAAGHDVRVLFMSSPRPTADADFPRPALDAFVEHCRSADVVGMSLMSNTFRRASVLAENLRRAGVKSPIVWGGVHATVAPEESLQVADAVCVGEGEVPLRDLLDRLEHGKDPLAAGSFCFRAGGAFGNATTVRNPVLPLPESLDEYPFPDYDLDTQWVIHKRELAPARPENMRTALRRLRVQSTRGCPYSCAFCNNAVWQNLYKGKGSWVRLRSNENVVSEIEGMKARFPSVEAVNIIDDLFFVRNEQQMEDFAERYTARVNLPLELDAFPNTINEAKVRAVSRLPITLVSMGIQSGSEKTLRDVYHRSTPLSRIVQAMELFRRYRIPTEYHYIISNPYEGPPEVLETMRFAATHHHGPSVLRIFPLMFYPAAPLYERARADGFIGERDEDAYSYTYSGRTYLARHNYDSVWLHMVLHLRNAGVPSWLVHRLIDVVTSRPVRRCLDRKAFLPVAFLTYQVTRRLYKALIYQPFVRPIRALRRLFESSGPPLPAFCKADG